MYLKEITENIRKFNAMCPKGCIATLLINDSVILNIECITKTHVIYKNENAEVKRVTLKEFEKILQFNNSEIRYMMYEEINKEYTVKDILNSGLLGTEKALLSVTDGNKEYIIVRENSGLLLREKGNNNVVGKLESDKVRINFSLIPIETVTVGDN